MSYLDNSTPVDIYAESTRTFKSFNLGMTVSLAFHETSLGEWAGLLAGVVDFYKVNESEGSALAIIEFLLAQEE